MMAMTTSNVTVTRSDIVAGLRDLGLSSGDIVLVHSSLSSLGSVDGGAQAVVTAFLDVLGPTGTLLVPTPGPYGAIMEAVKGRADAVHSIHPRASVAAVGGQAEAICREHWKAPTAHGEGTPYTRIADLGGYVCLLGVDQDRNTSLHTVEALLELPYLTTTREMTFDTPEGEVRRSWPHFPGPHRDFIGLDRDLRERGIVRLGRIGGAAARLMRSRELFEHLLEVGRADPAFALCDNPNCADCTLQRAAIRRHRFGQEAFRVVAAASLAGDSAEAIGTACAEAGVDAVELDAIGGVAIDDLSATAVGEAAATLAEAGCPVVGLRSRAPETDTPSLLRSAAAAGVPRLVLPLTAAAPSQARAAADAGIRVSFYNRDVSSEGVCEQLQPLAGARCAHLAFDPVGFVRVGEKPFLTSLQNRLKRFTDQLDLHDATFAGEPTRIGYGNGEVKELVSILRCSSFDGTIVLGAGNAAVADLRQTAIDLERMLLSL
jgi:aminoglycoside 3-N-acetyltransferase